MDSKHTIAARLLFGLLSAAMAASFVEGKVQGTAISVSTNSDGVTQLSVSKPTLTEEQVISYIMNPFSKPQRSIQYGTLTPQSGRYINVVTDPLLLLVPKKIKGVFEEDRDEEDRDEEDRDEEDRDEEDREEDSEEDDSEEEELGEHNKKYRKEDYYVAYILPKGLSSLPAEKKVEFLSDYEDVKKIGLLLFPNDLDAIKHGEKFPSSNLFPLDYIKIREIKVWDGETKTVTVDSIMDVFVYMSRYYGRFPWLVLRDVKGKVVHKREPTPETNPKEYGTIFLDKDGIVTWKSLVPNPLVPIPEIPPIPWFGPFPYPFFPLAPPAPYWNPNFYWPLR